MISVKNIREKIMMSTKDFLGKGSLKFMLVLLACLACIITFMYLYFGTYGRPYMMGDVVPLTEGWAYRTAHTEINELATTRSGPMLPGGETLFLYRRLDVEMPEAAILIRANHQAVNVFLDDVPLLTREIVPGENPGMALHFITLPYDYYGRTLRVELTSPFAVYSGRTGTIFIGRHTSLQAFTLSASMRSMILMAMTLLMGLSIIALTFVQALKGFVHPQNLAIGVFAVIWAFYYVCVDFIVFQFFTPIMVSKLSLGLYFSFQAPLSLFFYFSLKRYKRWMLPAVILHCGFPATAILLQTFGIVDFAQILFINNILLVGFAYTLVLLVLDAIKGNRILWLYTLFYSISYFTMLSDFNIFYRRLDEVPYNLRDAYFLLIMCVLIRNIAAFFRNYYRQAQEEQRLTADKAALDRLNHMKSELIATVTHETMTPLAVLSGYAELIAGELRRKGVDEQTAKDLDNIAEETQRIAVLMDELNTQTRTNDNKRTRLNIAELIDGTARMYSSILARKNVGLALNIPSERLDTYASAGDITQVMFNLLQNARNHTENGQASIAVTADGGEYVAVTVSDTGVGIPPEILPRVFERGVSGSEHGSGLGLHICKDIIDAHGGMININSNAEGTAVRFTLPLWKEGLHGE